jgi:hypothetical protein
MYPPRLTRRLIAFFSDRQAGRHTKQDSWIELQLAPGEYTEIGRLLSLDEALAGFIKDKIRYVRSIAVSAAANHIHAGMTTTQRVIGLLCHVPF